jgi:hypothetical protein
MKKNAIAFLVLPALLTCLIFACRKTTTTSTAPASSLINGLTSVGRRFWFDTGNVTTRSYKYVTWSFTGTNPVIARADIDTSYYGHQQLFFTGAAPTRLVKYLPVIRGDMTELTATVTYNANAKVDTIAFAFGNITTLTMPEKLVFQYSGDKVSSVKVACLAYPADTFKWATPDYYYFTYTGSNISQILACQYRTPTKTDTLIFKYFSGAKGNNLGGSMSAYILLRFLENPVDGPTGNFIGDMPVYTNSSIVDSTVRQYPFNTESTSFTTITDDKGRVSMRIIPGNPNDTTFYHY